MISIPLFLRQYSKNVRLQEIPLIKTIGFLFSVPLLIFIQDMLRQHSDKNIMVVSAHTLQALRGLLFEKLLQTDYKFLQISDPSLLSRLIFSNSSILMNSLIASQLFFQAHLLSYFLGFWLLLA